MQTILGKNDVLNIPICANAIFNSGQQGCKPENYYKAEVSIPSEGSGFGGITLFVQECPTP
jgi:hypothetical protein